MKDFKIAVIVPTKNRWADLEKAIISARDQVYPPHEIVIIDQSRTDDAHQRIIDLMRSRPQIKIKYVFNNTFSGLTAAKNAGVSRSESDILLFIDDDIILDSKFLQVLNFIYGKYPELSGVGGLTDLSYKKAGFFRRQAALFFQIGPFRDLRAAIQAGYMNDREIIRTWWLSGGLSSLKKEVLEKIRFNEQLRGASPIEDFDFFIRSSRHFQFALAPQAHALHNVSALSRDGLRWAFEKKCSGFFYLFSKYVDKTMFNRLAFFWRNTGFFIDAIARSIVFRSFDPIRGTFSAWYKAVIKR
ncbi:MAG: glycosyltransferase, partial [Candidatus Omnitrophica bacterium]|nr:glycosyltransferase [Candidatus Omnitrophota bacterium]